MKNDYKIGGGKIKSIFREKKNRLLPMGKMKLGYNVSEKARERGEKRKR